ncbi:hypothetical protein GLOIN_2v1790662 [Rhizophagus irregularis DAOM 181602=DAOM 197198]|uniref:Uncharacterized protein n=1 Tax=Rhizophagus irregularis (strain DAOM 181602 / DAOM 197198 / MUCL 43194) TaxID=747089 RepID=A0A2P4NYM7_RHIID|nr:hypothetical protein GLOIN_2v1790662 [Rhizophagus irregularis DAOM 181602=DAOM 197198]POG58244.1 hypothetical protein GLOIN_2v1790662 [Rhizophagus irregularis DAOM 181602=DAOM 197198]|eukprot:XP_025165110.1 hypothetical protein GLOIN_2v1790662 [Rhizophagus irregularis DAOM 181602=DAOM 197198]
MSTNSDTSSTSNNNTSSQTQPSNSNDNVYKGVNDQGNKWTHRGDSVAPGGSFRYSNNDGSYYYQNPNAGSKTGNTQIAFEFTSTKKETDVDVMVSTENNFGESKNLGKAATISIKRSLFSQVVDLKYFDDMNEDLLPTKLTNTCRT